jgi:ATP-dependent helicase/nuclease subunit B
MFLLGANDHVLPDPGESGGILNDDDRDALAERGIRLSPGGMERMKLELQNLYAALAQGTRGLVISYPVADVSGTELRPAFLIERIRLLFPDLRIEKEGIRKEYRLTAVIPALETAGQQQDSSLWKWFETCEGAEGSYSRKLDAMKRADTIQRGKLSRTAVRALYGDRISMSASRLERLRSCHFAYFMEYGLKAKPRTPATFDAPQIGTFLHYLLEHVTKEVLSLGGFAAVDQEELHALVRKHMERYVQEELQNFQEKNERFR